jgi:hypothetical protein
MSGKENFPFIKKDELMSIFFLYGLRTGINGCDEASQAFDLAERTVLNMDRVIQGLSRNRDARVNSESIRSQYVNRALQIVGTKREFAFNLDASHDPVILSNSFANHISYYNHDYFFQLYGPLLKEQVIKEAQKYLVGRIVLIGYNRKDEKDLPYPSPLSPLYVYMKNLGSSNSSLRQFC